VDAKSGPAALADWMTARDNPYFARNAVNRVWADLFGVGLVDPIDDLSGQAKASHPELLDELAKAFVESGYDLKYLQKALMLSRAYQLGSALPQGKEQADDPRLFGRMRPRLLSSEVLYDSVLRATGQLEDRKARTEFLARFARTDRPTESQRSILQALQLM